MRSLCSLFSCALARHCFHPRPTSRSLHPARAVASFAVELQASTHLSKPNPRQPRRESRTPLARRVYRPLERLACRRESLHRRRHCTTLTTPLAAVLGASCARSRSPTRRHTIWYRCARLHVACIDRRHWRLYSRNCWEAARTIPTAPISCCSPRRSAF